MKNSIFVLFILLFFQCAKDDDGDHINCIGKAEVPFFELQNCDSVKINKYYCEIYSAGYYNLAPSSKKFMPLYCKDTGSIIAYKNNNGEEIIFSLREKYNRQTLRTYQTQHKCPSDSIDPSGYCIISDQVSYVLSAESIGLEFMIILKTFPDISQSEVGYIGDILEIFRKNKPDKFYYIDFSAVVNQRTLSYNKTHNQEFYPKIEIAGTNFNNVISNDSTIYQSTFYKCFYNNEYGLIAFIDPAGVTWTLKE